MHRLRARGAGSGNQLLGGEIALGRRRAPAAGADHPAHEPPLPVYQVRGRRTKDAVRLARHLAGLVDQHARGIAALLRSSSNERGILTEADEQDLEPLALELASE